MMLTLLEADGDEVDRRVKTDGLKMVLKLIFSGNFDQQNGGLKRVNRGV